MIDVEWLNILQKLKGKQTERPFHNQMSAVSRKGMDSFWIFINIGISTIIAQLINKDISSHYEMCMHHFDLMFVRNSLLSDPCLRH